MPAGPLPEHTSSHAGRIPSPCLASLPCWSCSPLFPDRRFSGASKLFYRVYMSSLPVLPAHPKCRSACKNLACRLLVGQEFKFQSCTSAQTNPTRDLTLNPDPNPLGDSRSAGAVARLRSVFEPWPQSFGEVEAGGGGSPRVLVAFKQRVAEKPVATNQTTGGFFPFCWLFFSSP